MLEAVNEYLRNCPGEVQKHCQRTGVLMDEILKQLNQESEMSAVRLAGHRPYYYHDLGKCIVPGGVLKKEQNLSPGEWKIMKRHTRFGRILFEQLRELAENSEEKAFCRIGGMVCRDHHERWDGGGYPSGLKGTAIPFLARVCAVADSWDAMVNNRCYRCRLSAKDALSEIEKDMGTQFDPEIAAAFLQMKKHAIHRESQKQPSVEYIVR